MYDEEPQQIPFEEMEHRAAVAEQKAKEAKKAVQKTFAEIANAALVMMSAKALVFVSLFLVAGLFWYAMSVDSVVRLCGATVFGGLLILSGVFKNHG